MNPGVVDPQDDLADRAGSMSAIGCYANYREKMVHPELGPQQVIVRDVVRERVAGYFLTGAGLATGPAVMFLRSSISVSSP